MNIITHFVVSVKMCLIELCGKLLYAGNIN